MGSVYNSMTIKPKQPHKGHVVVFQCTYFQTQIACIIDVLIEDNVLNGITFDKHGLIVQMIMNLWLLSL